MDLELNTSLEVSNKQTKFIESKIGQCVSTALDVGICYIFPTYLEQDVIDIKNNLLEYGIKDGLSKTFSDLKQSFSTCKSLLSGKINSVEEYNQALSDGGIVDKVSSILTTALKSAYNANAISYSNYTTINKYKNVILDSFKSQLKNSSKQYKNNEALIKANIETFNQALKDCNKDEIISSYNNISLAYEDMLPTVNLIEDINTVFNTYSLLESKNFDFNLSEDELKALAVI